MMVLGEAASRIMINVPPSPFHSYGQSIHQGSSGKLFQNPQEKDEVFPTQKGQVFAQACLIDFLMDYENRLSVLMKQNPQKRRTWQAEKRGKMIGLK